MKAILQSSLLTLFCVYQCLSTSTARADLILLYQGNVFSQVVGSDFVPGVDRIFGTFTFDNILKPTSAKSIHLTATVGGIPQLIFDIPDTSNLPSGVILTNNFYDWVGSVPTDFSIVISEELGFGAPADPERIQMTADPARSFFSDGAAIDVGSFSNVGLVSSTGTWTAVPEPSAISMLTLGVFASLTRNRRNKNRVS